MQAYFTKFDNDSNWVKGKVGRFRFDAKLFNVGSRFGIEGRRVSALTICDEYEYVVNYDRGWDIEPSEDIADYFNAVMDLLENSDERDLD